MGKRGPKPGTQPRRVGRPVAKSGAPDRPAHLKGDAAQAWDVIVGDLGAMGVLGQLDVHVLTGACEAWSERQAAYRRWCKLPAKARIMHPKNGAPYPHPYWRMYLEADKQFMAYIDKAGLSPAARGKIQLPVERNPADAELTLDDLDGDPEKVRRAIKLHRA